MPVKDSGRWEAQNRALGEAIRRARGDRKRAGVAKRADVAESLIRKLEALAVPQPEGDGPHRLSQPSLWPLVEIWKALGLSWAELGDIAGFSRPVETPVPHSWARQPKKAVEGQLALGGEEE